MTSSIGSCVICTSGFRPDKIAALPCGHTFHYDCVIQWIQTSKNCPSCRVRCIERNVIKNLFFNSDMDTTINGEDELDSVKFQLHEKKKECEQMEKKLNSALSESAVNQKERHRWQKKAEEGMEATKKVGQLQAMLVDQNEKEKEIRELKAKLKASKFYQVITTGGSDEKLDKYIRSDGEVNTDHFLHILKNDLKKATEKIKEERKKREEAESKIPEYKRLVQGLKDKLKGKEADDSLVERLDHFSNEKRLSLGGDNIKPEFSDEFLGSAMRPAPKGKINRGKIAEECNTILDIPSASRRPFRPSPEKDVFDVVMSKKVSDRIGHNEKMSNGMGGAFSMKNTFDRLSTLPLVEKENRGKPYDRMAPKKKIIANNARLSDFFSKKSSNVKHVESVDLDSTICID
ncbi:trul-1 [Pristionchus pacificus]|uniref:RING-type domain-containing protein n=1 Tax=Pristionchus pacificus TaxID=54126 RepID=A0A8R1UAI8_PRIPA|nr:trul-1 [Pristionchus pacificus]